MSGTTAIRLASIRPEVKHAKDLEAAIALAFTGAATITLALSPKVSALSDATIGPVTVP